jgi:hypothetical protein
VELAAQAAPKMWPQIDSRARRVAGEVPLRRDRATQSRIRLAHVPVLTPLTQCRWAWSPRINRLQGPPHCHFAGMQDNANRIVLEVWA